MVNYLLFATFKKNYRILIIYFRSRLLMSAEVLFHFPAKPFNGNESVIVFCPFVKIVTFTTAVFVILKLNQCKRSTIFL